jgi:hypothetical protein
VDKAELIFNSLKEDVNENVDGKVIGLFCSSENFCSFFSNLYFGN